MDGISLQIRTARVQLGWTQAELARQLKVGQQAVSNWESGRSTPPAKAMEALSTALGIQLATAGPSDATAMPIRPLTSLLPLHELPAERFEEFVADLVQLLHADLQVSRYGAQGHTQHGIDVVAMDGTTIAATFQCKRHQTFGPQKVKDAIAEFKLECPTNYLVLSRPAASPAARQEIAKNEGWALWDAEDLCRRVRYELTPEQKLQLVDTYFPGPGWREHFLGIAEPGVWLTPTQAFRPAIADSIYSQDWQLVGRAPELAGMLAFAEATDEGPVGLLVGRGGIGKTRLLRQLALDASARGVEVRLLAAGAELGSASTDLLPRSGSLLVIVDDAHDRTDTHGIVQRVLRERPNARILISLRPYAKQSLQGALQPIGLHPRDIHEWTLSDLSFEDAEALAREALGPEYGQQAVSMLAGATADCPLITVIGGRLIRRGQLDAGLLGHGDEIRAEVLRAYRDALIAETDGGNAELRRSILDALALLQPFQLDQTEFQNVLAALAGVPFDRTMRHLHSLEDGGVLLRRGNALRIVPDLLGDVILTEACVDDRSGTPTGYIERAFKVSEGSTLANMLLNTSRIDWQVQRREGKHVDLTRDLWAGLLADMSDEGIRGRQALVALLSRVAYFAPRQALDVARWLIDNPTDEFEELEGFERALLSFHTPSYDDVLHDIPPLLRSVAYNPDYLQEALDMLWELASTDDRPTNQYPNHALRVLKDLAGFAGVKPVEYNIGVVDAAERWLRADNYGSSAHSPFDVLEEILATEGSDERSTGLQVQFSPFAVNAEVVAPIRERVVQAALREIRSADPKQAVRAVKCLEAGLRYPMGMFGREISDEERARWTKPFIDIIERLGAAAGADGIDPVVVVASIQALHWHADYAEHETQPAAEAVRDSLPMGIEQRLAVALYDTWNRLYRQRSHDYAEAETRKEADLRALALELLEAHDDDALVALLESRLQVHADAFGQNAGSPGQLFWILASLRPSFGLALCVATVERPQGPLISVLPPTLSALAEVSPREADLTLRTLVESDSTEIKRCVAQALGWGRGGRTTLLDGELEVLTSLATDDDQYVRAAVVRVAQRLATSHKPEAMRLLSLVVFEDSPMVAEELVQTFGQYGELSWNDVPATMADGILRQLSECSSIEGHWSTDFLATLSASEPVRVVELLIFRGELWELGDDKRQFSPLPYQWPTPLRVRGHADYGRTLRRVLEWTAAESRSWQRQETGGVLFMDLANDDLDTTALSILEEALATGREGAVAAVAAVLRKGPKDLAFDNIEFVRKVLRAASLVGEEAEQKIGGAICAAAISGTRSGTPGEPFAEDVFQLRRATEIADQMPRGSLDERLYRSLADSAQRNIEWSAERDAAFDDSRDWR